VDALFRSAARWCGARVIGVVLSGSLDDGAAGLAAIAECGGAALVQRPEDARFDGMPTAGLTAVPHALSLPAAQLGRAIADLVGQPVRAAETPLDDNLLWETDMLAEGHSAVEVSGQPLALGCPECSGGMYRIGTGNAVHFACHVGHSFSPQTLVAARDDNVEAALWTAISALQEKAVVLHELARHAAERGDVGEHDHYHDEAGRAAHAGELLRRDLTRLVGRVQHAAEHAAGPFGSAGG
jgi:two-component system chemotaxis response regulator CheB